MKYGFIKTAAATPKISLANPANNAKEIIKLINKASLLGIELLVFPEMSITGYTCGELFLSSPLIKETLAAIESVRKASINKKTLIFIGAPLLFKSKLYSCAIALQKGKILGVIPKTALPAYNEFYEPRHFKPGVKLDDIIDLSGQKAVIAANILFQASNDESVKIAAEICEDMFIANPPSIKHAQAGALIIVNLSASNEIIGKSDYRRTLINAQSGRLSCAYVYASAGEGESVSDIIFSGHRIISENGSILNESPLFDTGLTISEIDISRLAYERRKLNVYKTNDKGYHKVNFDFYDGDLSFERKFSPTPFVPSDKESVAKRAELILQMQSYSLAARLKKTGLDAVVGISGGLDSCLALLVILRAYEILKRKKENIIVVTMPGFGTSVQTLKNVEKLQKAVHIKIKEIPISKAVISHLKDIGHKGGKDIVYENAQARERTQILMDIANAQKGLVIGTGDLSENALGWCTYSGDHISMYGVNSSVPKTLVKYLVSYEANRVAQYKDALTDILNTEISPELLPSKKGKISQKTEDIIGPYELHDFFLYYTVRFGQSSQKTMRLASEAFKGRYKKQEIEKWFAVFIKRFFRNQFKRNCWTDGVKIGTISLSPRGDWRMPSEADETLWLKDIKSKQ
ncbi:MAG: NAD(+) synthase [Elusimicrobiota bacterium]|jgi:NAD+ synthase (glutamine-hydrolysing)|nr:NAD(+) synthase [Elusimicrobiota bacterium]